ncbi:hypothetical protein KJA15_02420 [Patescibacteria group bacterium]|nr:hypothetical protein [Patescibacteria group bacterium]
MKLLIYGFGPYKEYEENITEKIIRKVKNRKNLKKIIFLVSFKKNQYLEKIREYKPDIIFGLGQCSRGKKIRIERKAINLKKENKKRRTISKNKPKHLFLNLKFKEDKHSYISYNAGKYFCNFSMYVIAEFCKGKSIKFAFFHIPKDFNLNRAVKFIEVKIDKITKSLSKIISSSSAH